jgi:tRNA nucleotidyltransferase (CCA-adding enzyme)
VVSSRSKKVVGIITRTDLIKILTPHQPSPGRQNLAARLENTLPEGRIALLNKIADVAVAGKVPLYIVGGFVRDLLLDTPSLDFDLVVEGDAIALAEAIQEKYGGRVTSHSRFGTAKWFLDKEELIILGCTQEVKNSLPDALDFISARREFYTHPSALPTVAKGSIKLDLHRRDFTINTLALRLDGQHYGELYDYWGGLADLRSQVVKVLHSLSFVDDPTRILRAVRYEQRYGFKLDGRTRDLMLEAKELLKRVSGDRIRHELDRIQEEELAAQMMDRLDELTILKSIHPDLVWNKTLSNLIESLSSKQPPREWLVESEVKDPPFKRSLFYILWLMHCPENSQATTRLRLVSSLAEIIHQAAQLRNGLLKLEEMDPSQATALLDRIPKLAIYAVYLDCGEAGLKGILSHYLSSWQHIRTSISGTDLQEAGLEPGPRYSEILTQLRNAWLDGEISSKQEEKVLLGELLQGNEASS